MQSACPPQTEVALLFKHLTTIDGDRGNAQKCPLRISHGLALGKYNQIIRGVENARRPLYLIALRHCFAVNRLTI
jgi:hypothetical protein